MNEYQISVASSVSVSVSWHTTFVRCSFFISFSVLQHSPCYVLQKYLAALRIVLLFLSPPPSLPAISRPDAGNEGKLATAGRRKVCVLANRVYVADGFACFMFMRIAGSGCMLLQVTTSPVKDPYNINNSSNCVVIWWNGLHILFCIYIHREWNEAARQTYI